jgi:hypothetical protein
VPLIMAAHVLDDALERAGASNSENERSRIAQSAPIEPEAGRR